MRYIGGKNQYGFYQKIINLIPKHEVYIETHLGSGAIMRFKKPAKNNIGIDIDQKAINNFKSQKNMDLICGDSLNFLKGHNFTGDEFIYSDPPYLINTRQSKKKLYKYDYTTKQHEELLQALININCNIMVSGYESSLYNDMLSSWNKINIPVKTRSGKIVNEILWMNYNKPKKLHDYNYIGNNYRERERIKRKTKRWINNLFTLPDIERNAIISAINDLHSQKYSY
jgi:site-specific DNA-adenine methylase